MLRAWWGHQMGIILNSSQREDHTFCPRLRWVAKASFQKQPQNCPNICLANVKIAPEEDTHGLQSGSRSWLVLRGQVVGLRLEGWASPRGHTGVFTLHYKTGDCLWAWCHFRQQKHQGRMQLRRTCLQSLVKNDKGHQYRKLPCPESAALGVSIIWQSQRPLKSFFINYVKFEIPNPITRIGFLMI